MKHDSSQKISDITGTANRFPSESRDAKPVQFSVDGESIQTTLLYELVYQKTQFDIAETAKKKMQISRDYIEKEIADQKVMYGVNTGFGAFSSVQISKDQIQQLQINLIRSHSAGIGEPFAYEQAKAMMILRANTLARGHSGVRIAVVEKILEFLNADLIPVIPSQGSVGASGDLAPLSHLALALIGEGYCFGPELKKTATAVLLKEKNIQPLVLKEKEGLSLINGCQVMTAIGLLALYEARLLCLLADFAGAMSLEALRGSRKAFDPLIAPTRPHHGESKTAANLRLILKNESEISKSHLNCHRVQDAYSLRCMPAVHGAVKDTLVYVQHVLETEANSSTDNPLVFAEEKQIISCGNFHGMPVAFAMDFAGIATASLASMSEARISKLINPAMSDLPAFLATNGGLQSGMMIVQVAAASLVSENKVLCHPASCDTIPTSADKEDHVSMGTIAARKFRSILENSKNVVAMEVLCAAQGLDLLRPLTSSAHIEKFHQLLREDVPFAKEDRVFSEDIEKVKAFLFSEKAIQFLIRELPALSF
ncbi:MAG: histidine ammonia-lyase [Pseudobdellovibrionaceae bacterium]